MQRSILAKVTRALSLACVCWLFPGCLSNKMLADTSFRVARDAAAGVETLHDFEAAEKMSYAGLAQLEGLHVLSPDNEDGLSLLLRAWLGLGQAFILDEYERALERGDERLADYQRARARAAFERGKYYGLKLLSLRAGGFREASQNGRTFRPWLEKHFRDKEDAPDLFWLGAAWLGRVATDAESVASIADLWIGVLLVEHVVQLDETLEYGLPHVILGAFHARGAVAELDQSKHHFDRALEINQGKYLLTQLQLAQRYYCQTHDAPRYRAALQYIIDTKDPLPRARLQNTIAKRYAQRYLENDFWQEECGFELRRSSSAKR